MTTAASKAAKPSRTAQQAAATPPTPHSRRDTLRDRLLATVDLLKRRRAAEIEAGFIDDYVALHWMEWHGGSLRLTTTGENLCKHLSSMLGRGTTPAAC